MNRIQLYKVTRIRKDEKAFTLVNFEPSIDAIPLELDIGKRGWFCYKDNSDPDYWHRVNTSIISSVTELSDGFDVETENSIYKFRKADE